MAVKVATAQATADQSKADADAEAATDARAQADFERNQELRKQNTISAQEFDAAQAAVKEADANLAAAKQKAIADVSKINEAKATQTAAEASVGMALATFRQAQTAVQSAQLDLSYTKIFAPCDGRVTRKAIEPGDYVQVGQQLMSIVQNDNLGRRQFQGIAVEKHADRISRRWWKLTRSAEKNSARTWTACRPAAARRSACCRRKTRRAIS